MEVDEDAKNLISREINRFRDAYKVSVTPLLSKPKRFNCPTQPV